MIVPVAIRSRGLVRDRLDLARIRRTWSFAPAAFARSLRGPYPARPHKLHAGCGIAPLRGRPARPLGLPAVPRSHPLYRHLARVWRLSGRWLPNGWLDALRQLALFAGAYYAYRIVRGVVDGQAGLAFENARTLVHVERSVGLFFEPGLQDWARSQEWIVDLGQLDVRQLALRGHDDVPDLALHRAQRGLLLRAQHVHGRDGPRARGLRRLPDRPAALPARVGLHRHRRRRSSARAPRTAPAALQPVRRGAEHARGLRADDRRARR